MKFAELLSPRHRALPVLLAAGFTLAAMLPAVRAQGSEAGTAVSTPPAARPSPRDPLGPLPAVTPQFNRPTPPQLSPVFFPPLAPVLDAELPPAPAVRDAIWADLVPHTNEIFYPQLGTRYAEGDLSRRHKPKLDAYRAARDQERTALRQALALPAGERPAALAALAETQDARLAALAAQADELRRELQRGTFRSADADWNRYRNWRLGDPDTRRTPQEQLADEYSVLRAAIYYQEGLSLDQRHLLREVVAELADTLGERPLVSASEFAPAEVIFFLPHGARFQVPADLPAEIAESLAAFSHSKADLRRELREALYALDRESTSRRETKLRELAARQAPRFAALEQQAEQLRMALATLPAPSDAAEASPSLPPALAARINTYLRDKAALQQAAHEQARSADGKPAPPSRAALVEFENRNRARLAALAAEARAIREEVARAAAAAAIAGNVSPRTVDSLLADFSAAFQRQQLLTLYRDYRVAVLEPGLSPAQRRLLFDAALAGLDQPGVKDWQAVPE